MVFIDLCDIKMNFSLEVNNIIENFESRQFLHFNRTTGIETGVRRLVNPTCRFGYGSLFRFNQVPLELINRQIGDLIASLEKVNDKDFWEKRNSLVIIYEQMRNEVKDIEKASGPRSFILGLWTVVYAIFFRVMVSDSSAAKKMKTTLLDQYEKALKAKCLATLGKTENIDRSLNTLFKNKENLYYSLEIIQNIKSEERPSVLEAYSYFTDPLAKNSQLFSYQMNDLERRILISISELDSKKRKNTAQVAKSFFSQGKFSKLKMELSSLEEISGIFKAISNLPGDVIDRKERFCEVVIAFCLEYGEKLGEFLCAGLFAYELEESKWKDVLKQIRKYGFKDLSIQFSLQLREKGFSAIEILSLLKSNKTGNFSKSILIQMMICSVEPTMTHSERKTISEKMLSLAACFDFSFKLLGVDERLLKLIQLVFTKELTVEKKILLLDLIKKKLNYINLYTLNQIIQVLEKTECILGIDRYACLQAKLNELNENSSYRPVSDDFMNDDAYFSPEEFMSMFFKKQFKFPSQYSQTPWGFSYAYFSARSNQGGHIPFPNAGSINEQDNGKRLKNVLMKTFREANPALPDFKKKEELRKYYKKWCLKNHPDKHQDRFKPEEKVKIDAKFQSITNHVNELSKIYDKGYRI